jgi:hypothetical protein
VFHLYSEKAMDAAPPSASMVQSVVVVRYINTIPILQRVKLQKSPTLIEG